MGSRSRNLEDYGPTLTTQEVAEVLCVSPATLCLWRRTGQGPIQPVIYEERTVRYSRADLMNLLGVSASNDSPAR